MKRSWKSSAGNPGDGWHFDKGLSMGYKNESMNEVEPTANSFQWFAYLYLNLGFKRSIFSRFLLFSSIVNYEGKIPRHARQKSLVNLRL